MKTIDIRGSRSGRGRPRKFAGPSRPVTVTLEERTLQTLAAIDPDRARAITRAVDQCQVAASAAPLPVEVVEVTPGLGVILIPPCPALAAIPWLRLAEIAPGRFLLTLTSSADVETIEVALADVLDDLPEDRESERRVIADLGNQIRSLRRAKTISRAGLLLVATRPGRGARRS